MDEAIFVVSEDGEGAQGFVCANHQTGYRNKKFELRDP
jgi:hypothetical protein